MPPVGFEPTISAGERPQTYAKRNRLTRKNYLMEKHHAQEQANLSFI
jgi:hypothetical protein